ncbi:hypothetical protein [Streptomyces sp. NPDC056191]|uniref:hypothetical protein n=1 Tax=Streptomyces sp. NPDC056191 TaxID=3345742 RepID=UPI0035E1A746
MIRKAHLRRPALIAAALAALAVSCSATPKPDAAAGGPATTAATADALEGRDTLPGDVTPSAAPTSDPYAPASGEKVRDAFATLQATLNDSCASDCAYFLGRVNKELQELNSAMTNDPKGPGHFREPLQKMAELNKTLAGDSSYENLSKHQARLIGTRDFVNTWMQGHPDDYR